MPGNTNGVFSELAFVHQPTSIFSVNVVNLEMCFSCPWKTEFPLLLRSYFPFKWNIWRSVERREALTMIDEGSLLLLLAVLSGIIRDDKAAMLQECILYSLLKEAGCC